jgi:dienelactone hydrolase
MKYKIFILLLALFISTAPAHAAVVTQNIDYQYEGTKLQGFMAYDDAITGSRPGILVVHEWWGLNDYVRDRAKQLAAMGYVAFALDMYGKHQVTEHPRQAGEWSKAVTANIETWRGRALAGLAVLRAEKRTDPHRIAAIGYCFGGATVQQLAYAGADIKGVVSFHGSLILPPSDAGSVRAKILIAHGAADPLTKPEQLQAYLKAMNATALDWQMIIFGGAKHAFTNPKADSFGISALGYSQRADRRSWQVMKLFFNEIFAD